MKRFNYKAKDKTGKLLIGEVEAANTQQAAKLIRSRGLIVISITAKIDTPLSFIKHFRERITPQDVATFTRQLSTMINAGLPITEALIILRSQTSGSMQKVVAQVLADIEAGESLSTSLSRHPKIFTPTYMALVKSGEIGGVMDQVLGRLADTLEKQQEFKGKVKGALIYPAIIVTGMFIVGIILMVFVIPRLTSLYTDFNAELPLPTKILIGISTVFIKLWPLVLALVGIGLYVFKLYRETSDGDCSDTPDL